MAWLMPALLALLLGTTGLADQFQQALEASQQGRFSDALVLWDGVIDRDEYEAWQQGPAPVIKEG